VKTYVCLVFILIIYSKLISDLSQNIKSILILKLVPFHCFRAKLTNDSNFASITLGLTALQIFFNSAIHCNQNYCTCDWTAIIPLNALTISALNPIEKEEKINSFSFHMIFSWVQFKIKSNETHLYYNIQNRFVCLSVWTFIDSASGHDIDLRPVSLEPVWSEVKTFENELFLRKVTSGQISERNVMPLILSTAKYCYIFLPFILTSS
jgi:hypothetical protein